MNNVMDAAKTLYAFEVLHIMS